MLSPYQTFHCLSTICWDIFRTPIQYSKFSFLEERWVAKEIKADAKNYIKQIKKENKLSFVGLKDVCLRKECPNCCTLFFKKANQHGTHEKTGNLVSR